MQSEAAMSDLRPTDSETAPASRIDGASSPVASDSDSALCAASSRKCAENSGSSGCTQYNKENVA